MTSKSVNLVSDLRDLSSHRDVPNEAWNLADQAADEIERLQSDLERSMANHTADLNGSVLALQAEIERLHTALDDLSLAVASYPGWDEAQQPTPSYFAKAMDAAARLRLIHETGGQSK